VFDDESKARDVVESDESNDGCGTRLSPLLSGVKRGVKCDETTQEQ
jgi:hypothetical protein